MRDFLLITCIVAVAGAALLIGGCSGSREWTPYSVPPPGKTYVGGETVDLTAQRKDPAILALKDQGCIGCHQNTGDPHGGAGKTTGLGCVDCHGGNGAATVKELAHPAPSMPERWMGPDGVISAANPKQSYTLLNEENWDWIRFVNPGDLRVATVTCGGCHPDYVLNVSKSVMTTASHFWGSAPYCNGILPNKATILGESYSKEGIAQKVNLVTNPPMTTEQMARESVVPFLLPLPRFEATQPSTILRVFEKGSRLKNPILGNPDREEDPGRPNNRLSDRGFGTQLRIDFPLLNVTKTRLNDPHLSFFGTNEQPGDYRSSGCTACHMVYANDRNPYHSGPYAKFGNRGHSVNPDPAVKKDEMGHPIEHRFTTAVPSSQCMVCHMHQPNSFVNSYYGFTMWAYEADGDTPGPGGKALWPETQKNPSHKDFWDSLNKNPEEAAVRGNWSDSEFLANSSELNANTKHTLFADYHGHGWMFRAAFKMDREGNLLDKDGNVVPYDSPDKFKGVVPTSGDITAHGTDMAAARRAVHLKDIHAEKGMHCVDCHFSQDVHGNGKLYAEYQAAVQITCKDCHGTVTGTASLDRATGPAASEISTPLEQMKVKWNGEEKARFERRGAKVIQRSTVTPGLEWEVSQVVDSVTPGSPEFNEKAAYAKTIKKGGGGWGTFASEAELAHNDSKMECYACHTSWITACFGCHLPQRGNLKVDSKHYEGDSLRNMATYNPQVARDAEFLLGVAGNVKGNKVAPVRSSSAVMISSEDAQRRLIYVQQAPISAPGYSSQAFNTHFPHTVRKTETRGCGDCHLTENEDNNAWLAQAFLLGTNSVGLMGYMAYVGQGHEGFSAVKVTEWTEPQAVIGSNLHRMAYPDNYKHFTEFGRKLDESHHHGGINIRSLQLRGEYVYTACGEGGFRIYDVANVAHKDFSERIVTSPVSPLGQDTHFSTKNATAVALAFNNPVSMTRLHRPENQEVRPPEAKGDVGNLHPLYRYAYISDFEEGLILADIECLTDGDPQNNFVNERAVTFNPDNALAGAVNLSVAGEHVYICCARGLAIVNIEDPLHPRLVGMVGAPAINKPTSVMVQFRYAFVTDAEGLKVLDVTFPERAAELATGTLPTLPIADARDVYVAKTYAYVAAGSQGIAIVDVTRPKSPALAMMWNADGALNDVHQVKVAMTNDSMFAYVADGKNGFRVVQLVSPGDNQPRSAFGWSPRPSPTLIATKKTDGPALCVSKALDRDRAVDESGNQIAVFGRIGGRPFNLEEMRRFFMRNGQIYRVSERPTSGPTPAVAGSEPTQGNGAAGGAGGGR